MAGILKVDELQKSSASNITISDSITISDDTESTSSSTGSLIVSGGVGIAKNVNIAGTSTLATLNVTGVTSAVKISTATKTADYTVLDDDGYEQIFVNPTGKTITITLPTASANTGRRLIVKVTHAGGAVTVNGEGSETIDGATTFVMQSQYDFLDITCNGTTWFINSCYAKLDTGWINTADETNREMGSQQVTYNGASGSFTLGETITEATSNNTGIIIADSGTVLTLKNVTGTGVFTNGRQITGSTSSVTANVNGNTINQDTNVTHNFSLSLASPLEVSYYYSTDKAENTTIYMPLTIESDGAVYNFSLFGVSTSAVKVQSGAQGMVWVAENGTSTPITATSIYYKLLVEYKK
jgi:hypothetical protein